MNTDNFIGALWTIVLISWGFLIYQHFPQPSFLYAPACLIPAILLSVKFFNFIT